MNKRIICVGGITIDRKVKSKQKIRLATSNPVSSFHTYGGVAHNVAKNLIQLTSDIQLQSVVGQDNEGLKIQAYLTKLGIDAHHVISMDGKRTAQYDVVLDDDGELFLALADMEIFDGISLQNFTANWSQWHQEDIIFLDTNLPQHIIEHAIQICSAKNIKLCIDPVSVEKSKKIPVSLENVYIIKPDRYEAESLTSIRIDSVSSCFKAGNVLLDKGVTHCIISLGELGYVLVNQHIQKHFPAIKVDSIKDVSGAGDAFIAGVLYELKQNSSIVEACHFGAAVAAMTLQSYHTVNESITLEKLKNFQQTQTLREKMPHAEIF